MEGFVLPIILRKTWENGRIHVADYSDKKTEKMEGFVLLIILTKTRENGRINIADYSDKN
jgi:hypothetical protein